MTLPIHLTLTLEQAAEVHTRMDIAARDYQREANACRSIPAVARMFTEGAIKCAVIARKIELQVPDFAELAERHTSSVRLAAWIAAGAEPTANADSGDAIAAKTHEPVRERYFTGIDTDTPGGA